MDRREASAIVATTPFVISSWRRGLFVKNIYTILMKKKEEPLKRTSPWKRLMKISKGEFNVLIQKRILAKKLPRAESTPSFYSLNCLFTVVELLEEFIGKKKERYRRYEVAQNKNGSEKHDLLTNLQIDLIKKIHQVCSQKGYVFNYRFFLYTDTQESMPLLMKVRGKKEIKVEKHGINDGEFSYEKILPEITKREGHCLMLKGSYVNGGKCLTLVLNGAEKRYVLAVPGAIADVGSHSHVALEEFLHQKLAEAFPTLSKEDMILYDEERRKEVSYRQRNEYVVDLMKGYANFSESSFRLWWERVCLTNYNKYSINDSYVFGDRVLSGNIVEFLEQDKVESIRVSLHGDIINIEKETIVGMLSGDFSQAEDVYQTYKKSHEEGRYSTIRSYDINGKMKEEKMLIERDFFAFLVDQRITNMWLSKERKKDYRIFFYKKAQKAIECLRKHNKKKEEVSDVVSVFYTGS